MTNINTTLETSYFCKCGCGRELMHRKHYKYGWTAFIKGHGGHSKEAELKRVASRRLNNSYVQSDKTKRKRVETMNKLAVARGYYKSKDKIQKEIETRLNHAKARGYYESEKTKLKRRISTTKKWKALGYQSSLENMLQVALKTEDINFDIHCYEFEGTPDIVINKTSKTPITVFVDGCFYHSCPTCRDGYFCRNSYSEKKHARDLAITQQLESQGCVVLRFWEHEIRNDLKSCVNKIKSVLELMI